ncbi:hypothetical protein MTR67_032247 [Solanum verrucosum]|uniref:dTMP kinase n=1 Tax=Solanum verrucosum TaxID=315347 RepID=A0AAF0U452_SOLVR|nr:hypothetical protein MTR67_032247 [Solanum verrucosum]
MTPLGRERPLGMAAPVQGSGGQPQDTMGVERWGASRPVIGRRRTLKVEETLFSSRSFVPKTISTFPRKFGTWAALFSLKSSLDLKLRFKPSRLIHMENKESSSSRGALIVLEGLDRCGKTSQSGKLYKYLDEQGHSVESWRFPDRNTGVGQMISSYLANKSQLDDHAIHLLFSANRWEKRDYLSEFSTWSCPQSTGAHPPPTSLMEEKLKSGTTLIVDRYSYSGVAFSSAKGLDIEWCKAPEIGLLAPDLVVYLDISPEKAAERGGYGDERYEQLEFQKKVAGSYLSLRDSSWKVIDATLSIEDVEKKLREAVLDCMMTCHKGKPLSQLWPC